MKTKIRFIDKKPMIDVDGTIYPALAYTTYFDECGEWSDFIKSGYKMFFINISFTDLPINNVTGFTPFRTGVFEKDIPDYSDFDKTVNRIIAECPDALIFPRIYISMPRKWINDNQYETVETPSGNRESLYSEKFMQNGAELLKKLVRHIHSSEYAERIAGYQLCGGTTQEWIHHDLSGSFSQAGIEKFQKWMLKKHGVDNVSLSKKSDFENENNFELYRNYCRFCSEKTAETIEFFAKKLKDYINYEQIVGVFYGYNAFVSDPLWGLHGLGNIIDSPYIDFFSSPCCYDDIRNLGLDWGDMLPVDSVKLHGKLCFIECDIRTHLTKRMQESRPGLYPENIMPTVDSKGNKTVWCGPDTPLLSVSALRKAFAHQLTKASGIWWFDMWGGWYHDINIMTELEKMRKIADFSAQKNAYKFPKAETVLFIDEKAYSNIGKSNSVRDSVNQIRVAMGNTGIPFDMFMVEDAEKVIDKYKFAIFTSPVPSDSGKKAIKLCKSLDIPHIISTEQKPFYSTNELKEILIESGIHCYCEENCVVYCGNGFLGVHTVSNGVIKIRLPEKHKIKRLIDDIYEIESDTVVFEAPKHSTVLFELNK